VQKTGAGWDGCPTCPTGFQCFSENPYYSQCARECQAGWDCELNGVDDNKDDVVPVPEPENGDCPNEEWDACGGKALKIPEEWSGKTCCKAGLTCVRSSEWWSSCLRK